MNDEQQVETIIDEALQTYPLVAVSPGFVSSVMAQVEAQPRVLPEQFRLDFLDVVMTLFIGGIVALLLLGIFAYYGIVNLAWLPLDISMPFNLMNSVSTSARFWLILAVILFAEIGLGVGVCVQLWQDRPYVAA
ncbi:MAG: hypothetical protein IAF02_06380 [Anaerolineae bacterium]|nr:hypothetical protein [Anaerolineae bacterium]